MSRTFRFPRNEASRRDRIAQHELIHLASRNIKSRNDLLQANPYGVVSTASIVLSGTAVAGGVLESEIVTGSETLIITLSGDKWVATLGDDNAITDAFIAGITGDLADVAGWNAQMALAYTDFSRDSDTVVTITLPATAGYSITTGDETVTVAPPSSSLQDASGKGLTIASKTFVITEGS